jgi:hypothetical protein
MVSVGEHIFPCEVSNYCKQIISVIGKFQVESDEIVERTTVYHMTKLITTFRSSNEYNLKKVCNSELRC